LAKFSKEKKLQKRKAKQKQANTQRQKESVREKGAMYSDFACYALEDGDLDKAAERAGISDRLRQMVGLGTGHTN
jgi:phosphopantothenate synthetase